MEEIYRSEIEKDWEDIFSAKKLQSQYVDFRPNKSVAKHYTTALCMYPYSARKVQFSISLKCGKYIKTFSLHCRCPSCRLYLSVLKNYPITQLGFRLNLNQTEFLTIDANEASTATVGVSNQPRTELLRYFGSMLLTSGKRRFKRQGNNNKVTSHN